MKKSGKRYCRRIVVLIMLLVGFISVNQAQSFFSINWEKDYDADLTQETNILVRATDGSFIFAGETSVSGTSGTRILIIKLDSEGSVVWQKIFGSNADYKLKSVLKSKTDGFYILGTRKTGATNSMIWVTKIDDSGNSIWESATGGSDNESMTDIVETSDNGIILCGYKEIKGDHDTDAWLIKYSKKGALESQALFGTRYINDEFNSIVWDNLNGYIVTGYSSSKIGGDKIPYIVKVDYRGTKVWEKLYATLPFTFPGSAVTNADGSIVCLARSFTPSGEFESITKLAIDPNGNLINNFSISKNLNISGNSFTLDSDGQLLMISEKNSDINLASERYLVKLDDKMIPVWIRPVPENVSYKSLLQINENSFICSGSMSAEKSNSVKVMAFQDLSDKLIDNYINQRLTRSGGMKTGETQSEFKNRVGFSAFDRLIVQYTADAKNELGLIPASSIPVAEARNSQIATSLVPLATSESQSPSTGNLPVKGKYYALLIAVNDYNDPNINNLDKPISDAEKLFDVLLNDYLFEKINVTFLKNPTREQIISSLDKYEKELTNNDNFLLFYAGHGYWNETTQKGYWLPSDAKKQNTSNWIGNSTVSDYIRSIKARHTLLISDACFGGSIFKTRAAFSNQDLSAIRLYELQSRKAMTSGMLTEVPDNSIFVEYLVKRLQDNQDQYLSSEQLFFSFKPSVLNNTESVPQYGVVFNAGDDGGDFIFVKRKH